MHVQTEEQTPDAWIGMVREPRGSDEILGPTQRAIIVEQFHRSFFGPGGFYWRDNLRAVGGFAEEIAATRYSDIISANTGAVVSGNVFIM